MTEGKSCVLEEMIQARSEFPSMLLILVDVMADGAVFTKEIAPGR